MARLLWLSVLVALVVAWCEHHLAGSPILSWLFRLLAVLASGAFVWSWKLVHGKDSNALALLRRPLLWCLRGARLEALGLLLLIFGSQLSSVMVIAGEGTVPEDAKLAPQAGPSGQVAARREFEDGARQVRFLAWTSPFGTPYRLEVDGYRAHSFDLRPWVGSKIRVEDLHATPSLLVRVPADRLGQLVNGEVELYLVEPGGRRALGQPVPTSTKVAGSTTPILHGAIHYFFRRRPELPDSLRSLWQLELADEPQAGAHFLRWSTPNPVALDEELPSGARLYARFHNASQETLAELEFTLGLPSIADVRLESR